MQQYCIEEKTARKDGGDLVASVIIPVYNKQDFLERCIATLDAQDLNHNEFEAIFIDDGSSDRSPEMLDSFAETRAWIRVIHQENGGVCSARNTGIAMAQGKYLFYLDPDDEWSPNVLSDVSAFFDEHYGEVDLVTYRMRPFQGNRELAPHFRYNILAGSGVYNLNDGNNCFICQTTMNVCVKNLHERNHTFDFLPIDGVILHEDLQYITEIVCKKESVGYCEGPEYRWYRNDQSVTNTVAKQTEIFESTISMYESLLGRLGSSRYVQALYFTDLVWKFREGSLLPYHYKKDDFDRAIQRIRALLEFVDSYVIVNHPVVDKFHRFFWLQQKANCHVECLSTMNSLTLRVDGATVYLRERVEAVLLRTDLVHGLLRIRGYLKSPCFQFGEKPRLFARMSLDGRAKDLEVSLSESSWSYYKAKTKTNSFWNFDISCPVERNGSLWLRVRYKGADLGVDFYLMPRCSFSSTRREVIKDGYRYLVKPGLGGFEIRKLDAKEEKEICSVADKRLRDQNPKIWAVRSIARSLRRSGRRIWLYHDCHGVEKNNGYYQFMHDIQMHDGVERYYVVNDPVTSKRHLFSPMQMTQLVKFGSKRHKLLFLAAEKVITAYVEQNNWMPFTDRILPRYSDMVDAEVVYLQHGVLHARMPWKYSFDRLGIDREVVSTYFEVQNLVDEYGFSEESLITAGAPRYDFMDPDRKPEKKILFAPSWRGYLVRQVGGRDWQRIPGALEKSSFFHELNSFLRSEKLRTILKRYGYTLELKLHPIMAEVFRDDFDFSSDVVNMAESTVDETLYSVFITDFSSYRFDFVYLKRAIVYFLPDETEFRAGLCAFRETDLPLGGCFGDIARTANAMLELLERILSDGGTASEKHLAQMNDFFLHYDNMQRDRIYKSLLR